MRLRLNPAIGAAVTFCGLALVALGGVALALPGTPRLSSIMALPAAVAPEPAAMPTPPPPPVSTITFVQVNSATPQSPTSKVTVPFSGAQTAGNLNVVVVGWNNSTSQVQSVVDTKGNTYSLAVGPTISSGFGSQSIYYAKNIVGAAGGANSVTVTFNVATPFPDIRILEYAGVDTINPVDATAAGTGSSSLSGAGPMITRNATDLLFAANTVSTSTTAPGTGFTGRIITSPDGDIAEDWLVSAVGSYTASAPLTSGSWIMQMVAFRAAGSAPPPPPDTTAPTVSVTSPAAGATLNNTVTLTANASDIDSSVAGVQFQIDGISVGGPITSSPYSLSFDTTQFANGSHIVTAYAWDSASNIGNSAPVAVSFSNTNPGNPAQNGYFNNPTNWPLVTVHINLMSNGKVLAWDGQDFGTQGTVWDPVTGMFTATLSPGNIFCSGHAGLPDGRVLIAGGHIGSHIGLPIGQIFDPVLNGWSVAADMANPRWYPTVTALPDGRMLVLSGETNCDGCDVTIPEIYDPSANAWTALSTAPFFFPYYPHPYVLADGRVLVTGTSEQPVVSQVLDLTKNTWTAIGGSAVDGGSSVMYLPGKFLKAGTSTDPDKSVRASAATAYVLDTTQPSPAWKSVARMAFPRTYLTLTVLPDGKVLVTGGGTTTDATLPTQAVLPAEIWDPATQTFTTIGSIHNPRLYHSIALLLPDARVLISGGGRFAAGVAATDQQNGEILAPPYLFKGSRPTIASVPGTWQYGQSVSVQTPDAASIAKVSLIRLGNVTHAINMSQRYLPLNFTVGSGALTVTAPANANLAPPGVYMLFLVNASGVPSVASMINFGASASDAQPPTQPTGLVATGGVGSVSMTWNPSTDNVGVAGYHVYRSTTTGFIPGPSNFIADASTASFTDSGLAAGTYFYRVAAFDAAGNISTSSNEASGTATANTTPPTAPANLVATAVSSTQINLTWTASTSSAGVTGYLVERCQGAGCTTFAQVATPTTTSFSDTALTASTSYSYRVRATDAAGNLSTYSNTASATTQAGADTTPPTAPTNLAATAASSTQINLTWTASTDNVGVTGYRVERCQGAGCTTFAQIATPTTTSFSDAALAPSTSYSYRIRATDAAGNLSTYSTTASATTQAPPDTIPPTAPTNLAATAASSTQINLTWTASTDNVGVTGYRVERCQGAGCTTFAQIATPTTTSFNDAALAPSTSYSYRARATDAAGNLSTYSTTASATTQAGADTTPPTAPTNLAATAASSTQINLTWTASTDNVGVTGYRVERCQGAGCTTFAQIATPTTTSFSDTALTASTSYSYRVRATDAAGNLSNYSTTASATTQAPPDTTPPTAPTNLAAAAASSTQINLTWTASTDNVGVTGYRVERCQGAGCTTFAQIATPTTTSFNDAALAPSTSYSYRVRATDAAGNLSTYSNTASVSTPANPPPTGTITFVQVNAATPQSPSTSVNITFNAAQAAGDLNVVIVGWNDSTATVSSVTDSAGNSYALAIGPTVLSGTASQSIYYAKNIAPRAAGANTVTVTFNTPAAFADARVLEYSGVDPVTPLDGAAANSGNSASSSSGTLTTTKAKDVLVAGNLVLTSATGPGANFTSRVITEPDGDIAEDRLVTATGSYSATAPLSAAGPWIMQMVAFRAAGQ